MKTKAITTPIATAIKNKMDEGWDVADVLLFCVDMLVLLMDVQLNGFRVFK